MTRFKQFRQKALARPDVKDAYDALAGEFEFLDQILKARAETGVTQAELAAKIGTTQSAIARLESGSGTHSPTIATLHKYAHALGYKLKIELVKDQPLRMAKNRSKRQFVSA